MDIVDLQTFVEVATTRSYAASAKVLGVSQTTVRNRIASLESELSSGLLFAVGQTLELTESGRNILTSAKRIVTEAEHIDDVFGDTAIGAAFGEAAAFGKDESSLAGTVTIGTTEYVATRHLSQHLAHYKKKYPNVRIALRFAAIEQILAGVEQGVIDIALCPLHQSSLTDLSAMIKSTEVWSYKLNVVVAEHDPLATSDSVSADDLAHAAAILPASNTLARQVIDDRLATSGLQGSISAETDSFDTMRSMVSIGMGWACLPDFETGEGLKVLDVAHSSLPHCVASLHRRDTAMTSASQAFLDLLPVAANPVIIY